jgi:hypothetical protein
VVSRLCDGVSCAVVYRSEVVQHVFAVFIVSGFKAALSVVAGL